MINKHKASIFRLSISERLFYEEKSLYTNMTVLRIIFFLTIFVLFPGHSPAQSLIHGSRLEKKIALTFDACPSFTRGGFDERITRILIDSGVPATFFLSGKWIERHRRIVRDLASVPAFELGNHTYSHPHCITIPDDSLRREVQRTEALLTNITGTSSRLFRPPFTETDQRVDSILQTLGYTTVLYDLASGDPDSTISQDRLLRYVVAKTRNGSIIVMHINGRGWHTAEVLPEIIRLLRNKGFTFVKVSEFRKKG